MDLGRIFTVHPVHYRVISLQQILTLLGNPLFERAERSGLRSLARVQFAAERSQGSCLSAGERVAAGLGDGEAAVDDEVVGVQCLEKARHLRRPRRRRRVHRVQRCAVVIGEDTTLGAADGGGEVVAGRGEELDAQLPAQNGRVLLVRHTCEHVP